MANERDYYFDTLKGILILLVVIGNSLELANPPNVNIHFFILFLYMFHMPLFAFISGYFSKKSSRTNIEKSKSMFILYIKVQIIYSILNYFIFNLDSRFYLFNSQWTLWYILSLSSWYILEIFIVDSKKWIIFSAIISLIIGFDPSVGFTASLSRTIFFLPFFVLGTRFKTSHIDYLKNKIFYLILSSMLILIILFFISPKIEISMLFEDNPYNLDFGYMQFFLRMFHYIGALILGSTLIALIPKINENIFSSIGKLSLSIYLIHSGMIRLLYPICNFDNIFNLVLSELFIITCILFISKIYYKLKKHSFNNLYIT